MGNSKNKRLLYWGNAKIFADFLRQNVDNFCMTRGGGSLIESWIMPPRVSGTFSQLHAAVLV
jgi:hypothetical protein